MIGESPFDAVVFAGDPAFALRTAPVLAYYDVGPDRALYLGNALWNQTQLLVEPSLQGGSLQDGPATLICDLTPAGMIFGQIQLVN